MKKIIIACAVLATGCATVGREVSPEQISRLQKGITTQAQVESMLGQPTTVSQSSTGERTLSYVFSHAQARPETFIPFIGPFIGGVDAKGSTVIVTIDAAGVVQAYSSTQTKFGYGPSSYGKADRSQPSEQP